VSDDVVRELWQRACSMHLKPSRLLRLAMGLAAPEVEESDHLESCSQCRSVFKQHQVGSAEVGPVPAPHINGEYNGSVARDNCLRDKGEDKRYPSLFDGVDVYTRAPDVPQLMRDYLRVDGPVLFPDGDVAIRSWQLGRLSHLSNTRPAIANEITVTIVNRAYQLLLPYLARRKLVLVCFGHAVHRLGTRLGGRLLEQGFSHLHVVLAHDFYRPTLVCAPHELGDADVTVIVDVAHTGGLMDRLFAVCRQHIPARIRGLALIDKGVGKSLSEDTLSLWRDDPEERIPIDIYLRSAPGEQKRRLTRFEPNAECAVAIEDAVPDTPEGSTFVTVNYDAQFVGMIQKAGALRCDYEIGHKRYPYVINVLDLLSNDECRGMLVSMASEKLADLGNAANCFAYHAGRAARAGKLAKVLAAALHWPVVRLGTCATTFAITEQQCKRLSEFRNVVIVDAAIRTGDSLTAITQAMLRSVSPETCIIAFCVLDALSRLSRIELSAQLGIDIRTLFQVALAPPTERVRNWMNSQKAIIREALSQSSQFSGLDSVLRSYCEQSKRRHKPNRHPSADEMPGVLEKAVSEAQRIERAAEYIGAACEQGKGGLIRHLPLDQVVHDRSVQNLLVGVMFNSMKPSIKESAIFALGAARNYDWICYDWLQCNRAFLGSKAESWKAVLMMICKMKLDGMSEELDRVRDAFGQFAAQLPRTPSPVGDHQEQKLFDDTLEDADRDTDNDRPATRKRQDRLTERVRMLMDVTQ